MRVRNDDTGHVSVFEPGSRPARDYDALAGELWEAMA